MKKVTVFTSAHAEDIAFGGAGEIATALAVKLSQDIYERMYISKDLGEDMYEVAIDVIFLANEPIRGRSKGVTDKIIAKKFDDVIVEHKLYRFESMYNINDITLPYVFDLYWDIKSLGELKHKLSSDNLYNPSSDIYETMAEYGIYDNTFTEFLTKNDSHEE